MTTPDQPDGGAPRLTPDGVFVVQLRTDSDLAARRICGRIEHVTSGRSDRFASLDELIAFMARHAAGDGAAPR
jgi:hypothetical protein